MKRTQKGIRRAVIILFWLAVWQIAAVWADNAILLVGPFQVLHAFAENMAQPPFWKIVGCSFARIGAGFFTALFLGLFLGMASYRFQLAEEIFAPVITALKSIPVASFVVLLLIWFGSAKLSFFISLLIVFPNVYVNTIAGLKSTDGKLLEMARVFRMSRRNRFFYIYRPALQPYLGSCLKISLGMSWKSGVAAEVIGLSDYSLGERLYMSKIYLDTAGLFAWTLTVILLSFCFEKAVLYLLKRYGQWKPWPGKWLFWNGKRQKRDNMGKNTVQETGFRSGEPALEHICKSYGKQQVIKDFSMTFTKGGRFLLMAPSGAGKTTLLRILTRLEQADKGEISGNWERTGMVFQEDRLCEEYDVLTNVMLTYSEEGAKFWDKSLGGQSGGKTGHRAPGNQKFAERREKKQSSYQFIIQEAACILPEECLTKPVKELSGGMRRRVSVLRAVLSDASVLVLDEPFAGLDEENRRKTAAYILSRLEERTLLVTTHNEEDVELLQGVRVDI